MICLKCGYEIIIGPGGCACTQAARRKREMEEAAKSGERLAELLKNEMAKPKTEAKASTVDHAALDEISGAVCDFHVDLVEAALAAAGGKPVTREHVERAIKKLRRDK